MNIGRILHQQAIQLKWYFLACLGLIMVLPLEEAVVNWRDGAGFYAGGMAVASVFLSPLLAGLLACANVQADMDDKRHLFWRSKPVGVASFMTLKFAMGLMLALFILACPVVFGINGDKMYPRTFDKVGAAAPIFWNVLFISIMAYSVCFLCNVLMRKTARAWLIGMAAACFIMLVPFMLPLNFKDITSDFLNVISTVYLSVMGGTSLIAFIASLIATAKNWHLQTNLKGLLWTGAAAVFLLLMLFTRQVANIKVLDEINMSSVQFSGNIDNTGDKTIVSFINTVQAQIDIQNEKIKLNNVLPPPSFKEAIEQGRNYSPFGMTDKEHRVRSFPDSGYAYQTIEGQVYAFRIHTLTLEKEREKCVYEQILLRSYKLKDGVYVPVSTLDLSECCPEPGVFCELAIRPIEDKLFVLVQDSYVLAKVTEVGQLQILDKNIKHIRRYYPSSDHEETMEIPLIPIKELDIKDQIRLTIDVNYQTNLIRLDYNLEDSLIDIVNDKITFCRLSKNEISRYHVDRWDEKYIYCKMRDARPFTVLEKMFNTFSSRNISFVNNGKFYIVGWNHLMVFDIRSERIRKLGHFERIYDDFNITDVEVLNDGNILMGVNKELRQHSDGSRSTTRSLYLLKNPE